jgi:hypothetical protein
MVVKEAALTVAALAQVGLPLNSTSHHIVEVLRCRKH